MQRHCLKEQGNRLKWWKEWVLSFPQTAWRINDPEISKSVGPVHILCKIIWIQNGHREFNKITPQGSSNRKQADEKDWLFLKYIRISAFKIYLKLKTLKWCNFFPVVIMDYWNLHMYFLPQWHLLAGLSNQ